MREGASHERPTSGPMFGSGLRSGVPVLARKSCRKRRLRPDDISVETSSELFSELGKSGRMNNDEENQENLEPMEPGRSITGGRGSGDPPGALQKVIFVYCRNNCLVLSIIPGLKT